MSKPSLSERLKVYTSADLLPAELADEAAALEAELEDTRFKVDEVENDRDCLRDHVAALEARVAELEADAKPLEELANSAVDRECDNERLRTLNESARAWIRHAELNQRTERDAENERLRQAWDEWRNAPHGQEYPPHTCKRCLEELYGQLSEAAAEGGKR